MANWFSFLFLLVYTHALFGGILLPARDMPVPMPNTSSSSSSFARSFSVKNTSIGIWPHDAPVPLCEVCLVMVDLQQEFIGPKGYLAMAIRPNEHGEIVDKVKSLDKSGDGFLSPDEFREALEEMASTQAFNKKSFKMN